MKLPSFKRLIKQDYPADFRDLVDRLASSLNIGIESLYNLGNNNITLKENMLCVVKDVTVSVTADGTPTNSPSISFDGIVKKPIGTQVIRAINQTNSTVYPTGGIMLSFTETGAAIVINNITGLPANNVFALTVVVYGG